MGANVAWRATVFVLRVKQWTDESKRHEVWVAVLTWSSMWIRILQVETLTGGLCPEGVVMCARACVSFFSRTQKSVALASTEAEYVAFAVGIKEKSFLRYIWSFIFPDRDVGCTLVKEDNVGAIHLAKNPATTPNSKHIDIRHHFIRERGKRRIQGSLCAVRRTARGFSH